MKKKVVTFTVFNGFSCALKIISKLLPQIRACAAGLDFQSVCSIKRSTKPGSNRVPKSNAFRAADFALHLSTASNAVC